MNPSKLSVVSFIVLGVLCASLIGSQTPSVAAQGSYGLQYNLDYVQPVLAGNTAKLVNIFTNSGTVPEQVTGISLVLDIGTFTASSGLPLSVPVGQRIELNMTEQIPSSASTGAHAVTATINFQYQDPSTQQWVTPNLSPLVVQGSINIANPAGLGEVFLFDLGVVAAVAVIAVVVVLLLVRRRKKSAPPLMPMPMGPPPGPPPSTTPP